MYLTLCRPSEAKFCVFRVLLSPHKFRQRLSVLCENNFLTEEHKNILPYGVGNGLTQKTRNTQNHAELDFFSRRRLRRLSQNLGKALRK